MPLRTFLALDLDEPIRAGLAAAAKGLDAGGAKIRFVGEENLHVTLKFLGDVPDDKLSDVCTAAVEAAERFDPFDFDVRGLLCVPPHGQARMIWADIVDPTYSLAELHDVLEAAMAGLGMRREERDFKPHVTLARIKFARDCGPLRRAVEALAEKNFGMQHAERLIVYTSELTPEGPIYTPAATAILRG